MRSNKASQSPLLPEQDAYFHLLVLLRLLDSNRNKEAVTCSGGCSRVTAPRRLSPAQVGVPGSRHQGGCHLLRWVFPGHGTKEAVTCSGRCPRVTAPRKLSPAQVGAPGSRHQGCCHLLRWVFPGHGTKEAVTCSGGCSRVTAPWRPSPAQVDVPGSRHQTARPVAVTFVGFDVLWELSVIVTMLGAKPNNNVAFFNQILNVRDIFAYHSHCVLYVRVVRILT